MQPLPHASERAHRTVIKVYYACSLHTCTDDAVESHFPSMLLQDEAARRIRLKEAGANLQLTDEQKGRGQQNNTLLELQRAAKAAKRPGSAAGVEKPKRPTSAAAVQKPAEPSADAGPPTVSLAGCSLLRLQSAALSPAIADTMHAVSYCKVVLQRCLAERARLAEYGGGDQHQPEQSSGCTRDGVARMQEADASGADVTAADGEAEDCMAAFEAAAAAVKAQRAEATAALEDRVLRHIKAWCADWEADLERRPSDIKDSGRGGWQTVTFLFAVPVRIKDSGRDG